MTDEDIPQLAKSHHNEYEEILRYAYKQILEDSGMSNTEDMCMKEHPCTDEEEVADESEFDEDEEYEIEQDLSEDDDLYLEEDIIGKRHGSRLVKTARGRVNPEDHDVVAADNVPEQQDMPKGDDGMDQLDLEEEDFTADDNPRDFIHIDALLSRWQNTQNMSDYQTADLLALVQEAITALKFEMRRTLRPIRRTFERLTLDGRKALLFRYRSVWLIPDHILEVIDPRAVFTLSKFDIPAWRHETPVPPHLLHLLPDNYACTERLLSSVNDYSWVYDDVLEISDEKVESLTRRATAPQAQSPPLVAVTNGRMHYEINFTPSTVVNLEDIASNQSLLPDEWADDELESDTPPPEISKQIKPAKISARTPRHSNKGPKAAQQKNSIPSEHVPFVSPLKAQETEELEIGENLRDQREDADYTPKTKERRAYKKLKANTRSSVNTRVSPGEAVSSPTNSTNKKRTEAQRRLSTPRKTMKQAPKTKARQSLPSSLDTVVVDGIVCRRVTGNTENQPMQQVPNTTAAVENSEANTVSNLEGVVQTLEPKETFTTPPTSPRHVVDEAEFPRTPVEQIQESTPKTTNSSSTKKYSRYNPRPRSPYGTRRRTKAGPDTPD